MLVNKQIIGVSRLTLCGHRPEADVNNHMQSYHNIEQAIISQYWTYKPFMSHRVNRQETPAMVTSLLDNAPARSWNAKECATYSTVKKLVSMTPCVKRLSILCCRKTDIAMASRELGPLSELLLHSYLELVSLLSCAPYAANWTIGRIGLQIHPRSNNQLNSSHPIDLSIEHSTNWSNWTFNQSNCSFVTTVSVTQYAKTNWISQPRMISTRNDQHDKR